MPSTTFSFHVLVPTSWSYLSYLLADSSQHGKEYRRTQEEQRRLDNFHYVYIRLHACVCVWQTHIFPLSHPHYLIISLVPRTIAHAHTSSSFLLLFFSCFLTGRLAPMWERQLADDRDRESEKRKEAFCPSSFSLAFESFDICVRVHCTVIPFLLLLLLLSSSPGIVVAFFSFCWVYNFLDRRDSEEKKRKKKRTREREKNEPNVVLNNFRLH